MPVLIVTYDLNRELSSEAYAGVLSVIKSEKNWAKLSESSYAMHTNMTPKTVFEKINPYLDPGDSLLVFTLSSPYYGQHSHAVIDWLGTKMQQ